MTSKEALNELIDEIKYTHNDGKTLTDYDAKLVEVIQKDLEILECFKKLFEGEDLDGWIEFNFYVDIPYINKIKEWLKNEI